MICQIIQKPDKRLLMPSLPVRLLTAVGNLVGDLIDTRTHHRAPGLAAVQIGNRLRVVAVTPNEFKGYSVMINPEIVELGQQTALAEEGCLSIDKGVPRFQVRRYCTVTVRFLDRRGQERTMMVRNFAARIIQHEIDHLDGKLIA